MSLSVRRSGHANTMVKILVTEEDQPANENLGRFGRYAGPATLILASLADGPKHGYALTKDIEAFSGVRLSPGTLYEALTRLESRGMILALKAENRRKPYRLTPAGAALLATQLDSQRNVAEVGLSRLKRNPEVA